MARAMRTVVGNTERLQRSAATLAARSECVRVVVFGGSVSAGMNIGGPEATWPPMLPTQTSP